MAPNPLDHSNVLDINLTVHAELADKFYETAQLGGYKNKRLTQLQVLLANLISNHQTNPDLYTSVSLANSYYKPNSRYNSCSIGKGFINLIRELAAGDWLELHKGFIDRTSGISRLTRIKPTEKTVKLLDDLQAHSHLIARAPNTECIIQRDEDKKDIEYEDTHENIQDRVHLTAYNNLLHKTLIDHPDFPSEGVPLKDGRTFKINKTDKFVRRIYNDSSFEWNGRFYGGWWQRTPKAYRAGIHLDGSSTCEIDFSAIHMVLLYAIAGIDYWNDIGTDPYLLDDFEQSDEIRSLLKVIVLVSVNAESRKQALEALRYKIRTTDREEFEWFTEGDYDLEDILNRFVKKHEPIQSSFFSSNTFSVMKIDAQIAEYIINHFTDQGIPVLAIHDSFLIHRVHEGDLRSVMQAACNTIGIKLFNQNVKETKIGFEGLDLTGFTHLLRTDREFLIDTAFKDKYSESEIKRRKEVESYRELVGEQDYYYSAKS
jgi:hypothetical protein